ncbi:6-pyruvoyl tetrahydrobiopterin synthase-like protein [Polychytrium aggregatum]|uniref:6-pyruvoyl tetrahydrobiopterin synthase-like protein n=1 Tax=Polychytrium aggregatum TaxID=110093 RepID=UPI0022FE94A2|nr:6-pyruvoyl tetrahydrobiopterin synthase-like protein [Polychytrium aggregatum]KAI9202006.1 6-pyruvoyl tetrahydrobiopterin synthase-like protein [Polychytrium aggregatum]
MPIVYITRRESFSAAHRLHAPALSDEENQRIFGKCNHIHGHGHNYDVEVTVKGMVDPLTGMVMNITDLKIAMKDVLKDLDHRHLDMDVLYFKTRPSTAENIAIYIWEMLEPRIPAQAHLHEVRVEETRNNTAIYRGEHQL